jgi:hypothetical protein
VRHRLVVAGGKRSRPGLARGARPPCPAPARGSGSRRAQPLDLAGVDVDAQDVVADVRQAGAGDEADIAGADVGGDLHREFDHRGLARRQLGLAPVGRQLVGDPRVLLVDPQDRAVRNDTVQALIGAAGRDDDHLLLALRQAVLRQHQRIVVREERTELVGPAGELQEHVRHETGLLLHREDLLADVVGQRGQVRNWKATDRWAHLDLLWQAACAAPP